MTKALTNDFVNMTAIFNLQLKCELAKSARPKVLVVSHERSGTHFLMNTLALNFGYVTSPWLNVDFELGLNFFSPMTFESFFNTLKSHWVLNVAKSHHEYGFYQSWLADLRDEFRILYIVRDPLDVMQSYHKFLRAMAWFEGPKVDSLEQFLWTEPAGAMTRFQHQTATDMVHRWCNHVTSWIRGGLELGPKMFKLVHYSNLDSHFAKTVQDISAFLDISPEGSIQRPDRQTNVVMPNQDSVLQAVDLSPECREHFNRVVAPTVSLLNQHFPA